MYGDLCFELFGRWAESTTDRIGGGGGGGGGVMGINCMAADWPRMWAIGMRTQVLLPLSVTFSSTACVDCVVSQNGYQAWLEIELSKGHHAQ